jgi:16S rRNA (uracil1498-N3)-methyltransferase
MADRYFAASPITADRATLDGPEAHHFIHVMRARPGTTVTLFDGSGCEFPAVVEQVGRSEVKLAVLSRNQVDRELPLDLTLGVALPKGDRQKWLVEKAVELGVTRIVPLATDRGVAQPVEQALARLRRTVIEASKQCGRNRLMEIAEPLAWPEFVEAMAGARWRLVAHPGKGCSIRDLRFEIADTASEKPRVVLAIGPEGGLTDEEVALALAAGWQQIDLGPRILRVETAAIVSTAAIIHVLNVITARTQGS